MRARHHADSTSNGKTVQSNQVHWGMFATGNLNQILTVALICFNNTAWTRIFPFPPLMNSWAQTWLILNRNLPIGFQCRLFFLRLLSSAPTGWFDQVSRLKNGNNSIKRTSSIFLALASLLIQQMDKGYQSTCSRSPTNLTIMEKAETTEEEPSSHPEDRFVVKKIICYKNASAEDWVEGIQEDHIWTALRDAPKTF